jgi:hypothetical protein
MIKKTLGKEMEKALVAIGKNAMSRPEDLSLVEWIELLKT